MLSGDLLAIYLNDHLAGATGGLELARRACRSNRGTPLGDALDEITAEIAEDRDTLERLMGELGIGRDRLKTSAAWAAEKVGRLKPNGRITSYSPLSRVVELELLVVGVSGKLALWRALGHAIDEPPAGFDFDALAERAERQRARLEELRLAAVREALAEPPASRL